MEKTINETVEQMKAKIDEISSYNWDTGTMIVLSPTRDVWSNRLFKKVNTNLGLYDILIVMIRRGFRVIFWLIVVALVCKICIVRDVPPKTERKQ